MPGFTIAVNDVSIGSLSTDGLEMVAIHVHGDTIGPEFAEIDITGGNYDPGSPTRHLIYMSGLQIVENDFVEIRFVDETRTSLQGKTIEELYPDKSDRPDQPESEEQQFRELEESPRAREHFNFELLTPNGELIVGKTPPGTFTFGLHLLWVRRHPERARVSVSSNTLSQIAKREGGEKYADIVLSVNQSARLQFRS